LSTLASDPIREKKIPESPSEGPHEKNWKGKLVRTIMPWLFPWLFPSRGNRSGRSPSYPSIVKDILRPSDHCLVRLLLNDPHRFSHLFLSDSTKKNEALQLSIREVVAPANPDDPRAPAVECAFDDSDTKEIISYHTVQEYKYSLVHNRKLKTIRRIIGDFSNDDTEILSFPESSLLRLSHIEDLMYNDLQTTVVKHTYSMHYEALRIGSIAKLWDPVNDQFPQVLHYERDGVPKRGSVEFGNLAEVDPRIRMEGGDMYIADEALLEYLQVLTDDIWLTHKIAS
jgi:hypothetical protein